MKEKTHQIITKGSAFGETISYSWLLGMGGFARSALDAYSEITYFI